MSVPDQVELLNVQKGKDALVSTCLTNTTPSQQKKILIIPSLTRA